MQREVLLLRAINVGGRKLSMAPLRSALEEAGCSSVATYIQSGNVVLEPPAEGPDDLQDWYAARIAEVAGFPVPVVRRTAGELEQTVSRNPFPEAGGSKLHVVFFHDLPPAEVFDGSIAVEPEAMRLVERDLYLHLPNGMARSKLAVEVQRSARRAGMADTGTARNWNTVLALLAMARG